MTVRALLALGLWMSLGALAAGCAQGGTDDGDRDAGGSRFDAGPRRDAGLPGLDAGPVNPLDGGEDDAGTLPVDAGPLPVDAGPPPADAGPPPIDAGPPPVDAGPPPGCTSAAECGDGLFCNGIERCNAGTCGPGTPVTCDDAVACTTNRCVEPTSGTTPSCEYAPVDAMCPPGQTCTATGCASACSESPCRLVSPQCGCATGGCYLSGATRSCMSAGTAGEGSSCTSVNSCAPGLACLNVSVDASVAVNGCMRFCTGDPDCMGDGSLCIYGINDGSGGTVPGVNVCSRSCDPISSFGCPTQASCQIFTDTASGLQFTDCLAPVGTGRQGAACTDSTDCARGFICGGGSCLRYCTAPGTFGGGCDAFAGEFCFAAGLFVGTMEYGVCDTL